LAVERERERERGEKRELNNILLSINAQFVTFDNIFNCNLTTTEQKLDVYNKTPTPTKHGNHKDERVETTTSIETLNVVERDPQTHNISMSSTFVAVPLFEMRNFYLFLA
jgi:hypothetical protein